MAEKKARVYQVAKDFSISSEALLEILRGLGASAKSHMSTVDETLRGDIKKRFESERAEIKKEYLRKKQKIAQAREEQAAKSAAAAPAAPEGTSA